MYYRRHRRSFRRRYARKKTVFGKRATRAIKAISQRPVETKWYAYNVELSGSDVGPVGWVGTEADILHNIWQFVPRADSALTRSRSEVLGQECQGRGYSLRWAINYPAGEVPSVVARCRITVFSMAAYYDTDLSGQFTDSVPAGVYEDEAVGAPPLATLRRFNRDRVKVLASRSHTFSIGGQSNLLWEGKLWVPMRRKIVAADPESVGTSSDRMNELKDRQFYLLVEFYDPKGLSSTGPAPNGWVLQFEHKVYWKDA